ncbi:MAG: DUF3095 domain-containing protein [Gammaproteobacteria bacterium]
MQKNIHASPAANNEFFPCIDAFQDFAGIADPGNYRDVPADWYVALTDVVDSTAAIEAGRYRDVNALGVASIVALCNAAPHIELPFVFGGDGATALLPGAELTVYEPALRGLQRIAHEAFGLELRVGLVPVAALAAAGFPLRVAKFRAAPQVDLAMFCGSGIDAAENWIKDAENRRGLLLSPEGPAHAELAGFECRWRPVASRNGAVVSLLVRALAVDEEMQLHCYRDVLDCLGRLVHESAGPPLMEQRLRLQPLFGDYTTEARIIAGRTYGSAYRAARRRARRQTQWGRVFIALGLRAGDFDGRRYRRELVENSDFRKFDATLRMVLDLTPEQAAELEAYLHSARQAKQLVYGLHRSPAALVTCFVRSYAQKHLHFVDGSDGGYTNAAKQLKSQLQETLSENA